MPKPELVATRDFTYMTRRLKAGDDFPARNRMEARVLVDVLGRATYAEAAKPVIPTAKEVLTAEVVEEKPEAAPKAGPKPKRPTQRTVKRKAKAKK